MPDVSVYGKWRIRNRHILADFTKMLSIVGNYNEGDNINLSLKDTNDKDYDYRIVAVSLDEELTKQKLIQAQNSSFDPDIVEGGHVKGTYTSEKECSLLLQVPYDSGWKITVNGENISYKEAFNGLIKIELAAGENSIEMQYCPPGLKLGAVFTITGIAVFCIWSIVEAQKRKKEILFR